QPAAAQELLCHAEIELTTSGVGEGPGFSPLCPAHLVEVKQSLQARRQIFAPLAAVDTHLIARLQALGKLCQRRPEAGLEASKVFLPRLRQVDNEIWGRR